MDEEARHVDDLDCSKPVLQVSCTSWGKAFSVCPQRVLPKGAFFAYMGRGNGLYYVEKGLMRIFLESRTGTRKTFAYLEPGTIFGEMNMVDMRPTPWLASAMTKTTLRVMEPALAARLIAEQPELAVSLIACLAAKLKRVCHQVEELSFQPAHARLASFVLAYSSEVERGVVEPSLLTHDEVASLVTSSRETVSRALLQMRAQGMIDYRRNLETLQVLDRRQLERLASLEL